MNVQISSQAIICRLKYKNVKTLSRYCLKNLNGLKIFFPYIYLFTLRIV